MLLISLIYRGRQRDEQNGYVQVWCTTSTSAIEMYVDVIDLLTSCKDPYALDHILLQWSDHDSSPLTRIPRSE